MPFSDHHCSIPTAHTQMRTEDGVQLTVQFKW
jgi:hypothetical protein